MEERSEEGSGTCEKDIEKMVIIVYKNTRMIVQGMTGGQEMFHIKG